MELIKLRKPTEEDVKSIFGRTIKVEDNEYIVVSDEWFSYGEMNDYNSKSELYSDVSINNTAIWVRDVVSIFEESLESYTYDLEDDEYTYCKELNETEEEKYISLLNELTVNIMDEKYYYAEVIYCKDDYHGLYENLDYDYLYVFSDDDDNEDDENEKFKGLGEAVSDCNWACNADVFLDLSDRKVWTIVYAGCNERTTYHSDDIINILHKSVFLPYEDLITKDELREICEECFENTI